MKKKYIITESQFKQLVENKKKQIEIANRILEDIEKAKKNLNEGEMLNEAIVDTIKKYLKKGLMTTAVIASLLANNVQAQTLAQAGVPQVKIEQAMSTTQKDDGTINPQKVEQKLLKVLQKRGKDGVIKQYNSLGSSEKAKLLNTIAKSIKKLSDIDKFEYRITDWMGTQMSGKNVSQIGEERSPIVVDTVTVDVVKDFNGQFNSNSSELMNSENTKQDIQELLNSFYEVDSVIIIASSSTLRNTGDAEGKTWEQLSTERGQSLTAIVNGMTYNLGGENVNPTHTISENMIRLDAKGENGDGTSGPKSPFEVNPKTQEFYQEKGIDPSLWKSAATQEPYANKADYAQHQYVKIVITGNVVETSTDQIVNYQYLVMSAKRDNIVVKKSTRQNKKIGKTKIIPCPIKWKV